MMTSTKGDIRYHKGRDVVDLPFNDSNKKLMFDFHTVDIRNARLAFSSADEKEGLRKRGFKLLSNFVFDRKDEIIHIDNSESYKSKDNPESDLSKEIRRELFRALTPVVERETGAMKAIPFTYTTRFRGVGRDLETDGNGFLQTYATFAHTDFGTEVVNSIDFIADSLKIDKEKYEFAWYNVWLPVINTVEQFPLALLDASSIREPGDVIPCRLAYRVGRVARPSITLLSPENTQEHRWYYYPRMSTNEALLFCQYDTRKDHPTRCYHTAFYDKSVPEDAKPFRRNSIEVRFVCIFPKSSL